MTIKKINNWDIVLKFGHFCEDKLEKVLVIFSECLFWFVVVFSRAPAECYCDAASGETRGHGAVLQESYGRSGTLAHHKKQG